MQTDTNEFESEEPTVVRGPEQWEPKEVEWMLLIAERCERAREAHNAA